MDSLTLQKTQVQVRVNSFVRSVYNWMAIGLALTGFVAYSVANMPEVQQVIFGSGIIFFGLIIAQLALVFIISSRIYKMQAGTATSLFLLYSASERRNAFFHFPGLCELHASPARFSSARPPSWPAASTATPRGAT